VVEFGKKDLLAWNEKVWKGEMEGDIRYVAHKVSGGLGLLLCCTGLALMLMEMDCWGAKAT
jgi:hypothetical protein